MSKAWRLHTLEYHTVIKRNKAQTHGPTEMNRENTLSERSRIQSLGQEDFLEKGIATHSSILACKILWMEDPGGPQSMALQRVRHD